jgi:hypothetical protein
METGLVPAKLMDSAPIVGPWLALRNPRPTTIHLASRTRHACRLTCATACPPYLISSGEQFPECRVRFVRGAGVGRPRLPTRLCATDPGGHRDAAGVARCGWNIGRRELPHLFHGRQQLDRHHPVPRGGGTLALGTIGVAFYSAAILILMLVVCSVVVWLGNVRSHSAPDRRTT